MGSLPRREARPTMGRKAVAHNDCGERVCDIVIVVILGQWLGVICGVAIIA